jgi:hypothetical protein
MQITRLSQLIRRLKRGGRLLWAEYSKFAEIHAPGRQQRFPSDFGVPARIARQFLQIHQDGLLPWFSHESREIGDTVVHGWVCQRRKS